MRVNVPFRLLPPPLLLLLLTLPLPLLAGSEEDDRGIVCDEGSEVGGLVKL
jgi:hypothetical protein